MAEYSMRKNVRKAIIEDMLDIFGNNVDSRTFEEEKDFFKRTLERHSDEDLLQEYAAMLEDGTF